MTKEQAAEEIRARYAEYLTPCKNKGKKPTFVCPYCRNHSGYNGGIHTNGEGHLVINEKEGAPKYTFHCFSCGWHGDVIDAYKEDHNCTTGEAFKGLYKLFGLKVDGKEDRTRPAPRHSSPAIPQEPEQDYSAFIKDAADHLGETDYYKRRGISEETARRFNLGFVANWKTPNSNKAPTSPRLIIPITGSSYIARDTRKEIPASAQGYKKMQTGKKATFNRAALYTGGPCFVTEGEFDALSIEEVGRPAVALSSVSMIKKFLEDLDKNRPTGPLVLCLDKDAAGEKALKELETGLQNRGIQYITADIAGEHKDPNEALVADRKLFAAAVDCAYIEAEKLVNTEKKEYLSSTVGHKLPGFIDRIKTQTPPIPADRWNGLNRAMDGGFYSGLYIIGAISSLGKTTWALQLVNGFAKAGRDVLIFSLEMSADELTAKSISRITAEIASEQTSKYSMNNAKTTRGILDYSRYKDYNEKEQELIVAAINQHQKETLGHLWIFEGVGAYGVDDISAAVERHITFTGNRPIVLIDYLQILAPADVRASDKQNTDTAVLELKRLSRKHGLTVIAISSLNRDNYTAPINMAAFKESGAVEYGSDVLIGLQYEGMDYADGEKEAARQTRIREIIASQEERGKNGSWQDIQVKILKNRNGRKGEEQRMKFYPLFNLFLEQ